jgi:hypothetical protein
MKITDLQLALCNHSKQLLKVLTFGLQSIYGNGYVLYPHLWNWVHIIPTFL